MGGREGESGKQSCGIGPVEGQIFREKRGAEELTAGESGVRIRAGEMGEGSEQFEGRLSGDKKEEFRKFHGVGTQPIHSRVEFGLNEGWEACATRCAGQFPGFGKGGEGEGEAMAKGERKFKRKGGAKNQDGLADSCLAKLNPLCNAGDTKLLAPGLVEGAGDRNEAVAVSVILDHGQNTDVAGQATTEGAKIVAEG